jgi:16S rRNA G966 N2-methylase RsmD
MFLCGTISHNMLVFPARDLGFSEQDGIVVLDAFCGCGGNAIAFGKLPPDKISFVVCVDIDRSKLRKAAYNASLYDIPNHKLIFIECNTLFILGHCYKDGALELDKLGVNDERVPNLPSPVVTEVYAGYNIGGLDLLPPRIDCVFMDPPWGGVEYNQLKNGYDLERHMKIRVGPVHRLERPTKAPEPAAAGELCDDFFDSFGGSHPSKSKKAEFNETPADGEYVNGADLVKMAAGATRSHLVVYDLPRNTNKTSLGQSALAAGYRGNLKLDEHYLNGRLKTVTAYMGADYCSLLNGS